MPNHADEKTYHRRRGQTRAGFRQQGVCALAHSRGARHKLGIQAENIVTVRNVGYRIKIAPCWLNQNQSRLLKVDHALTDDITHQTGDVVNIEPALVLRAMRLSGLDADGQQPGNLLGGTAITTRTFMSVFIGYLHNKPQPLILTGNERTGAAKRSRCLATASILRVVDCGQSRAMLASSR